MWSRSTGRHVFLWNKKTCLLVSEEDASSCSATITILCFLANVLIQKRRALKFHAELSRRCFESSVLDLIRAKKHFGTDRRRGLQEARRLQDSPDHKKSTPLSANTSTSRTHKSELSQLKRKSSFKILILWCVLGY